MTECDGPILAITSSTAMVGVAVVDGGELVAESSVVTDRRHAEELTPRVQEVLADASISVADIARFAVDVGPGRFTGLRVGLATIRTLALAANAPVVGVTSLELLAAAEPNVGSVCAVIDARRNEVFQQRFVDGAPVGEAAVGLAVDLAPLVRAGDLVIGDGADRYADDYLTAGADLRKGVSPSAATLARLAISRPGVPGPSVAPVYLRDADVQINIKTRHNT